MLKLRRGTVVSADPLVVSVEGRERPAWADAALVGEAREGDEVLVNVEALDLELGSGGFDVVHANLTRGLEAPGAAGEHVMKLNYTSLQHPVEPVEPEAASEGTGSEAASDGTASGAGAGGGARPRRAIPVLVCFLHGQLAPAAWAAARARPGLRTGYVQGAGGALPGTLSRDVRELRSRGLLCAHVTAGSCFGGEAEAISVAGALHAGADELGWDAAIVAPGPGILGSASALGHGGIAALDNAHAALALGLETLLAPRLSAADPRPRHRGVSHHTETVLELLLAPVAVPAPGGTADLVREACAGRHTVVAGEAPLEEYAAAGLPVRTMGRGLDSDALFFEAALAAGDALGAAARDDSASAPAG